MSVNVSIKALEQELIGLIQELPTFKEKTYSIYDLDDLERFVEGQTANLPIVGVGYDGAVPTAGRAVNPKTNQEVEGAAGVDFQFVIIIALRYGGPGEDDTKPDATDLLGEIRTTVLGRKSVGGRAWRFIGERPEPDASGDGVIFYSQVWQTMNIVRGSLTNS